mgnify:CR=1 FL=1
MVTTENTDQLSSSNQEHLAFTEDSPREHYTFTEDYPPLLPQKRALSLDAKRKEIIREGM